MGWFIPGVNIPENWHLYTFVYSESTTLVNWVYTEQGIKGLIVDIYISLIIWGRQPFEVYTAQGPIKGL